MGDIQQLLLRYVLTIPIVLFSLSVHECAHGFVSYKLGDPTARNMGRLTLNPIKHLDLIGSLMMLIVGIGWAKPVPINPRYYKNPRTGMALTAAAGPISNLLLGFICVFIYHLITLIPIPENGNGAMIIYAAIVFFANGAFLNVTLAVFNLIPVPPFDGSRIAYVFLPAKLYFGVMKYERYIMIAVIAITLALSRFGIIGNITGWITGGMDSLIELIPGMRNVNEYLFLLLS